MIFLCVAKIERRPGYFVSCRSKESAFQSRNPQEMSASAITVVCNGVAVPLECHPSHPGLDLERCKNAKPFADWLAGLDSGLKVSKIVLRDIDFFGPRVGFLKL